MNPAALAPPSSTRVGEIDALRGIAALLVVLFHYTTRFDQLFGHAEAPIFTTPWGHYGVNLFFLISGFVIYMTLERTRSVSDFVVSRFSRLYPAFWAAVPLTWVVVFFLGLPGKEVSIQDMVLNLLMFHGLFRVPHVDSVYWTLEVELLFYALVLLAFRFGWMKKIHLAIFGLLILRTIYFVAEKFFALDLPWIVGHLLIIKFIPWFAIGIMIYRLVSNHGTKYLDYFIILASLLSLASIDSPGLALIGIGLSLTLYAAASGKLGVLRWGVLVWLGEISYTLYLLHENIGWAVLLKLKSAGLDTNLAIAATIVLALAMASFLTRFVEQPVMKWIRLRYRQRMVLA